MRTIYIKFSSHSKEYAYLYSGLDIIAVGTCVVVDSPMSGLTLVKVTKTAPTVIGNPTSHIVGTVDSTAYDKYVGNNKRIVKLKADLKKKLDAFAENQLLIMLLSQDKEAAKILIELEQLNANT